MSKLDELINELCPYGVEYKTLGEVLKIKNGKDYKQFGFGNIPVYGSGGVMTYIDTFVYNKPSVLIPRKGSIDKLYYIDIPFWTVDTLFYTEINSDIIIPKFVYYFLQKEHLETYNTAGGVPSLTQSVLNKIPISLPPLLIQEEIVRILDNFTELTAELTAELTDRKKQYEYYRDSLLTFGDDVEWKTLGKVCDNISSGKNKLRDNNGAYSVYGSTGIIGYSDKFAYISQTVLVARVGANCGYVHIAIGHYDVSDNTLIIVPNYEKYSLKFAYYQLTNMNLNQYAKGGGQPLITAGQLKSLSIPLPPLAEQERIVSILDKFDALTSSITEGLPAEIEARKKQYEYYRDKLLTFTKAELEV